MFVVSAGDDADLCSELLQESLDALRALPEATLFDEGTVSSVWLEVVERATKFLRLCLVLFSLSISSKHLLISVENYTFSAVPLLVAF